MTPPKSVPVANNLDAFFRPFTANRQFKANPRMLSMASCGAIPGGKRTWKDALACATSPSFLVERESRWPWQVSNPSANPKSLATAFHHATTASARVGDG